MFVTTKSRLRTVFGLLSFWFDGNMTCCWRWWWCVLFNVIVLNNTYESGNRFYSRLSLHCINWSYIGDQNSVKFFRYFPQYAGWVISIVTKLCLLSFHTSEQNLQNVSYEIPSLAQWSLYMCVKFFLSCKKNIKKLAFSRTVCLGNRKYDWVI